MPINETVSAPPAMIQSASHQGRWLNLVAHLDPRFGGISAMLPSFCEAVGGMGRHRLSIGAFCAAQEQYEISKYVSVKRFPEGMGAWLRRPELRAELRTAIDASDGIHIHGLWREHCAFGSAMARNAGKPYLISAHGMVDTWAVRNKRWKKMLYAALVEKRNLTHASCLHALTAAEAGDYRRMGLKNPIAIVPNGVAVPAQANAEDFLCDFPSLRGKRILLFLARIHFKKGLDPLCRAWAKSGVDGNLQLVLAGPDFEGTRSRVERLVSELGIDANVTFTGMLSGKQKWGALAAADAFTLPSYSEGLSVSVLEAMAMGLPAIVTRQCNVPEVRTANCGWEIEPGLPRLIAAIEQWKESAPASLRQLGANGRHIAQERYSWESVGRQMSSVYDWLLGGQRPQAADVRFG